MVAGDKVAGGAGNRASDGKRIERSPFAVRRHGMLCRRANWRSPTTTAAADHDPPAGRRARIALVAYLGAEDTILELSVTPNRGIA